MLIGASEIIIRSVELFKQHWKRFLLYVFLFVISSVLLVVLQVWLFPEGEVVIGEVAQIDSTTGALLVLRAVWGLLMLWLYLAFIRFALDCYEQGKPEGVLVDLEESVKLIVPAIVAAVLSTLATTLGFLLLIIPGIIVWVWLEFSLYEVAGEEKGGLEALKGSKKLVEGRWWQVLWRLVFPVLVFTVAIALIQGLFVFFLGLFFSNSLALSLIPGLVGVALMPLPFLAVVILYSELKKTPAEQTEPHPDPEKGESEHNVVAS
ncbi:MAG: hypothetical protein ABEJ02_03480 [Candidatus Paceibacteria bacterium]